MPKAVYNREKVRVPIAHTNSRELLGVQTMITNSVRSALDSRLTYGSNPIDSMYCTFGYKTNLTYDDYYAAYKRQGLAKRIIDATVDFTWKDFPAVIDEDDNANNKITTDAEDEFSTNIDEEDIKETESNFTEFEEAVYELQKKFPLLRICKKVDRLNCIGRYSILVIGTKVANVYEEESMNLPDERRDGDPPFLEYERDKRKKLEQMNDTKNPLPKGTSIDDIAYLYAFAENQIQIDTWEQNMSSPRFGMPVTYKILDANDDGVTTQSFIVHWTRVIHVAEDLLDSEVYGTPKLEAIYNDLQDMLKVVGASAEMFWLGAYQGLVFNVKDGYTLDEADGRDISNQIENYVNKLQRFMQTKGIEVSTLSSPTADPTGNFEVLLKLISGASNIPTRILIGSEQGQLAASVDQDTFFSYITSRRNSFIDEAVIRPLLDRLVEYGYMPSARNGEYYIEWPALFEQTQEEKLANARILVETARAASAIDNPKEILTIEEIRVAMGLSPDKPETQYDEFGFEDDLSELDWETELDNLLPDEIGDVSGNKETEIKGKTKRSWLGSK